MEIKLIGSFDFLDLAASHLHLVHGRSLEFWKDSIRSLTPKGVMVDPFGDSFMWIKREGESLSFFVRELTPSDSCHEEWSYLRENHDVYYKYDLIDVVAEDLVSETFGINKRIKVI